MVKELQLVALASLAYMLGGCGLFDSDEMWSSGPFSVYWIDTDQNSSLGHDMGDGSSLGIVEPCVFAAGANERFVAAARAPEPGGAVTVYVVNREMYDPSREQRAAVAGPFSEQEYAVQARVRGFPQLTETMPRSRCSSGA